MFWLRLWSIGWLAYGSYELMKWTRIHDILWCYFRRLASLLLSRQILSHFFVAILYPARCLFATIFCCMIRVFAEQLAVVSSSQWAPERTWGVVECDVLCEFDMQFDFRFFSLRLSSSRHFADFRWWIHRPQYDAKLETLSVWKYLWIYFCTEQIVWMVAIERVLESQNTNE